MLSGRKFIQQSLETHLFFARIMKEHSFFLQIGFTQKNSMLIQQANTYRMEFDRVLAEVTALSNGIVSQSVLRSGEVITPYTLEAEKASAYFTGISIPTFLSEAEASLMGDIIANGNAMLEQRVVTLNERTMALIAGLAKFKAKLLSDVNFCRVFTVNYPLLIDHILREAKFYFMLIKRLQNHEEIDLERDAYEQEVFWNRIMAEHSKFIRGLLDPTEEELIDTANNFAHQFDKLTQEAIEAMNKTFPISRITEESFEETKKIKEFKQQGTQGLIECKIKSIIIPLLGDHTLREANHYLRLLKIFSKATNQE